MVNRRLPLRSLGKFVTPVLAAATLALAAPEAEAARSIPIPKLRPSAGALAAGIPIPRLRPRSPESNTGKGSDSEAPPSQAAQPAVPKAGERSIDWPGGSGWSGAAIAEAHGACQSLLAGRNVEFTPQPPLGREGGCGAPAPISLTSVAGVAISPPAITTCPMAAALDDWLTGTVQPSAQKRLKTRVTTIHAAASYVCRLRNNASTGKLSEHGRANALDMSGFSFAKAEAVSVGGGNWGEGLLGAIGLSGSGSFLSDIRKGACDHFTTVLGPGSDPYHGNHFHVDVLQRKGGYRICQ